MFEEVACEREINRSVRNGAEIGNICDDSFHCRIEILPNGLPAIEAYSAPSIHVVDELAVTASEIENTVVGCDPLSEIIAPKRFPEDFPTRVTHETGVVIAHARCFHPK